MMTSTTLFSRARRAATLLAISAPIAAGAQTRGFLVRLGADTFAVERFTRTGDRIEGTIVRHLPSTLVTKYTLTLNSDGSAAAIETGLYRADGSPMPPNAQSGAAQVGLTMRFVGDTVVRVVPTNGQPVERRTAVPKGTLPAAGGSWLFFELAIQQAKRDGSGGYQTIGFGPQATAASPKVEVRLIGADSAEIVQQGFRTGFRFDRSGQLVHGDGSLSTQKFDVRPIRDADVAARASAWAARETPNQAPAPLSFADTVNADLGGAHVTITYGRPAARGRAIWGALVPYDTTWRLGANFATVMTTDKDLDMGGVTVPAGKYTLWLYPTAGPSFLIVNKKTWDTAANRPLWGTMWDPAEDVVRIPLDKHMNLPASEERFRIFVQGDMLMMHWDKGGYGVRVKGK